MVLKPQDIVVFLKLVALAAPRWTYVQLAYSLYMSVSEINAAVKRGIQARLMAQPEEEGLSPRPIRKAMEEFLVHGVKYAFPPDKGEILRGIPTGYAAPPLSDKMILSNELPPVWPYVEGNVRGYSFSPLYKSVPKAAEQDSSLYALLVLVDAIRDGRAREQDLAVKELRYRLKAYKEEYRMNLDAYRKGRESRTA
jgi:hypothetical protein